MRLPLLALLLALSPYALADVEFTSPAPGGTIPAGQITVAWKDSGVAPSISQLSTYTLVLIVGGNDQSNQLPLTTLTSQGQFASGNSFTGTIPAGLAGNTANGFYFQMISVAKEGGIVINYSSRFSMSGMTGTTPPAQAQAVTALGGNTAGPPTSNQVNNQNNNPAAGAAPGAAEFAVPYNLQTGLTKYAPMQPVPPTKITAQNPSPLFTPSAFTIATTWLPRASVVTTLTQSQTFSVSSVENTAAPVSQPTGDMAKYLARWKD